MVDSPSWSNMSTGRAFVLQIIRNHRLEREADYAEQREREWERALAKEAQRHKCVNSHLLQFTCMDHLAASCMHAAV